MCTAGCFVCAAGLLGGRRALARRAPVRLRAAAQDGGPAGGDATAGGASGKAGSETPDRVPEELVEELEGRMHELASKGDYVAAAAVRDELCAAQFDDEVHVLSANTELYSAFSARDIDRIKALWLQASYVQCIHPYDHRKPTSGYSEVCSSWKSLFDQGKLRRSVVSAENVRVNVRGATATVSCVEQVSSRKTKRPQNQMLATNVFRKVRGRWLLIHRHVSHADGVGAFEMPALAEDADDPEGMAAWKLAQLARAVAAPGASIIIKQGGVFHGASDEDDSDDELHEAMGSAFEEAGLGGPEEMTIMGQGVADDDVSDHSDDEDGMYEEDVMEAARDTVRALRRLSREGKLTQQARIQLLSQMIRTPGESMPERAHELLLHDVMEEEEKAAAWEDFAALVAVEAARLDPPIAARRQQQARDGPPERRD